MSDPFVTVFMPVYNSGKYLVEAIESILRQTYRNLELLIVDDGSTDHSIEIIETFADPRIRLIKNDQNRGIPFTRNVGLKEARGKYLAIMDSDDISHPERIERQVAYLENHPAIDVVGTFYVQFSENRKKKVAVPFIQPEELKLMLLFYNPIANPSVIMRKETLDKYQLRYDEDYFVAQDYQLWSQLIKVGNICILPEYLLFYRFGHENISKKSNEKKRQQRKKLIDRIHIDLLSYYGIPLDENEVASFNEFFTETYGGSVQSYDDIIQTIEKLKLWNKKTQTFAPYIFTKVLDYCVQFAIEHQKIPIKEKMYLYSSLTDQKSLKNRFEILAKHFYHRLQKIY